MTFWEEVIAELLTQQERVDKITADIKRIKQKYGIACTNCICFQNQNCETMKKFPVCFQPDNHWKARYEYEGKT